MITLSTIKDVITSAGKRVFKVLQHGPKTATEASPFGDDSNPLASMTAIYAETEGMDSQVIIGYINTKQLAGRGEKRLYSLKADGSLASYVWLKNDGQILIGGDTDNMVRFTPLQTGLNAQDALINTELAKIAAAIGMLGGTYAPGNISTDISGAKINEIQTI